jgi:hypothetical protein
MCIIIQAPLTAALMAVTPLTAALMAVTALTAALMAAAVTVTVTTVVGAARWRL